MNSSPSHVTQTFRIALLPLKPPVRPTKLITRSVPMANSLLREARIAHRPVLAVQTLVLKQRELLPRQAPIERVGRLAGPPLALLQWSTPTDSRHSAWKLLAGQAPALVAMATPPLASLLLGRRSRLQSQAPFLQSNRIRDRAAILPRKSRLSEAPPHCCLVTLDSRVPVIRKTVLALLITMQQPLLRLAELMWTAAATAPQQIMVPLALLEALTDMSSLVIILGPLKLNRPSGRPAGRSIMVSSVSSEAYVVSLAEVALDMLWKQGVATIQEKQSHLAVLLAEVW